MDGRPFVAMTVRERGESNVSFGFCVKCTPNSNAYGTSCDSSQEQHQTWKLYDCILHTAVPLPYPPQVREMKQTQHTFTRDSKLTVSLGCVRGKSLWRLYILCNPSKKRESLGLGSAQTLSRLLGGKQSLSTARSSSGGGGQQSADGLR